MTATFNKERCEKRNRQAALRFGIDTAHVNFLSGPTEAAPVEFRNYGGSFPASDTEALAMINAMLPEGADALTLDDVYIHYVEAANNNFIEDRYGFLSRSTLRNVARDGAAGCAFMNSHRTGGLSTDAEFPFGKTFAGQYQEGRDAQGQPVRRTLLGFYMQRNLSPNGAGGPSTDDLDRQIRGGTLFDVSVGLYGGARVCDVCGGDVTDADECPHLPGTYYAMDEEDIERQKARGVPDGKASYTMEDARLGEVSGVFDGAVRGAGFRKAVALRSKLGGEDLRLAREVYGGLKVKDELDRAESLLERLSESIVDGLRRAFGGKQPPTMPALEDGEANAPAGAEGAEMSEQTRRDDAEVERLRKDSEELQRLKREARGHDAEAFAKLYTTGKDAAFTPDAFNALKAEYLQRAEDDERSPLASGSRVENLKQMFAALPAHNLTTELAASELPPGAAVLNNDSDPLKASVEKAAANARAWAASANPTPANGNGHK